MKVEKYSELAEVWRRLTRSKSAVAGIIIVSIFAFSAVFAPWIAPKDPNKMDLLKGLETPNNEYLLGRDEYGRDILSRIIYGSRISLFVGIVATIIGLSGGIILGSIAAFVGGNFDHIIMRIFDIILAFPSILLAIGIMAALGPGLLQIVLVIGVVDIPRFGRIVRGSVLSIKENDYITAAIVSGAGVSRIIFVHVLPNIVGPIIVIATLSIAGAILSESSLSFLGLGVEPPTPTWGAMLNSGRQYIRIAPHLGIFPGLAITLTVLGFNLLGDGLRDALDPRLRK